MSLYSRLIKETYDERQFMMSMPFMRDSFSGSITIHDYTLFLTQQYHYVKQSMALLMDVGSYLEAQDEESSSRLKEAANVCFEESVELQDRILSDIAMCGLSKNSVLSSKPFSTTEFMMAYSYDTVMRRSPICFFGIVYALDMIRGHFAENASLPLYENLPLPPMAYSHLSFQLAVRQEQAYLFEKIMVQINDPAEQDMVVHCAKMLFRLYANMLNELYFTQAA